MQKIKASEYSNIVTAHSIATHDLNHILEIKNLPEALKNEVKTLQKKFKEYDLEQHAELGNKLVGEILSADEIKKILVDATGYTKWEVTTDYDEDEEYDPTWLLKHFGVGVEDKSQVKQYRFTRSVRSRDDIWMITVVCLPGHVELTFDTDRANYGLENLVANKDIEKEIVSQFN